MRLSTLIEKAKKLGLRLGFMKFIGYEAIFSCAFRRLGTDDRYCFLPNTDDYWYADPLICVRDGRQIVFMERVNRHTGIGCIACADITDGSWGEIVPVIEESFHMSFPMCFEWGGELYMIPETEMDERINLYRNTEFPYKWERVEGFMEGRRLVDTVLTARSADDKRLDFLTSEYKPGDDFYTRFRRFALMRVADGAITCEDLGLVSEEYTLKSRMAGYVIDGDKLPGTDGAGGSDGAAGDGVSCAGLNGRDVYPVQRSTSGVYGYSVMMYAGDPSEGKLIREILPGSIRLDKPRRLIGVHTYSISDQYEVIDVQYLVRHI